MVSSISSNYIEPKILEQIPADARKYHEKKLQEMEEQLKQNIQEIDINEDPNKEVKRLLSPMEEASNAFKECADASEKGSAAQRKRWWKRYI